MSVFSKISFFALLFLSLSCQSQTSNNEEVEERNELPGDIYISDFGTVRILQINDTLFETYFENNEGHKFDTSMVLIQNDSIFLHPTEDESSFTLRYNWGGLYFFENQIQVYDFAGYGMLGSQTIMWDMYSKPFYKINERFKIKGDLIGGKGLWSINEIYLIDSDLEHNRYYELEGILSREKWPEAYYSTDKSPQGIFGDDTSKNHHRLILTDVKDKTPKPYKYKGSTINISTGEAAISWEFADSEAFILDGHEPWTKEEELQDIVVEGILVQNGKGSFLKNWKIISE